MKAWAILLCLPVLSYAAIGTVTEQVNTPASIQRQNKTVSGAKGAGVEMDDAIRTQQGKVGITFADDTKVQVNENSKLVIDDFVYDPKKKTGKLALNMALGTVRYASGAIAHNDPKGVSVHTPSATITVRGTDFTASVDELGQSTIILLPSCPDDKNKPSRTVQDIDKNCITGEISVESDAGFVILNQPFQATRVESRGTAPSKPVILKLSEDAIGNMLLITPPRELKEEKSNIKTEMRGFLDVDYLKEQGLTNALDAQQKDVFQDKLSRNFLDNSFLANVLDMLNAQIAAQQKFLDNNNNNKLLPDWFALSGITVNIDEPHLTLERDNGSDIQNVTVPSKQNTTIYMTQGSVEFKNRVNSGGGTTITLIQK